MKVLVLGCGPAGLMAAFAASGRGHDVMVFSKARKSYMRGAQYLHRTIPGATPPGSQFFIDYQLRGDPEQYRNKVYGAVHHRAVSAADVSASLLVGQHLAFDIRKTYDELWNMFGDRVQDMNLNPEAIDALINWSKPDLVVSTIPASLLCVEGHQFRQENIWSVSDQKIAEIPDNVVVCNALDNPRWYRGACIQGNLTFEWPYNSRPPVSGLHEVVKPISTNCTCFPDILRAGRYGRWEKGILSHDGYERTLEALKVNQGRLF